MGNDRRFRQYVEPYAGGAAVGLRLLFDEHVDTIVLNDLDPGIAAFWRSVFQHSGALIARIRACRPTIRQWHRQHEIYHIRASGDDVELGFATLFLNRVNRSGILTGRPIGGLQQQGRWKLGARFNPDALISRVRLLARYSGRVTVSEFDGEAIARRFVCDERSFVYVDPPYIAKGADLYLDTLTWQDHERLARVLRPANNWVVTYDADPRVRTELYPGLRCASFGIAHTAAVQHIGREYAVFADELEVQSLRSLGRSGGRYMA